MTWLLFSLLGLVIRSRLGGKLWALDFIMAALGPLYFIAIVGGAVERLEIKS